MDGSTEVVRESGRGDNRGGTEGMGGANKGMNVEQATESKGDFHVEIVEKLPATLEERENVIGVVLEEGGIGISRDEGVAVKMTPVAVVADTHVFGKRTTHAFSLCRTNDRCRGTDRNGESLQTVGRSYDTAVTIGLLGKGLHALYLYNRIATELLIPLHGAEIGRGKEGGRRRDGHGLHGLTGKVSKKERPNEQRQARKTGRNTERKSDGRMEREEK